MSRKKYAINLSCGQTDLYPSALAEMGKQLHTPIYYLPYYELEIACIKQLQTMMHTKNDVLTLVGTATYGEEAAMMSTLERGDRVLTVNTGVFGQVLTDVARAVGAEPTEIKLPAGHSITPEQVQEALRQDPTIKMVAVVQVETSRGTVNPVDAIGYMLQREFPHILYLVDAVSGLAATELRVDEWGIDLCCTSSQKAVNAPQGVAIVSVSPKAWKVMEERKTPIYSLCLDLLYWRHYHQGVRQAQAHWYDEGPSDPALSHYKAAHGPSQSYVLMKALKASLDEIMEEGLENVLRRHKVASRALRAGIRAMGLQTLASEENAAPDATCVVVPGEQFDVRRFMRLMWEEYGIATAGGSPSREAQGYVGFRVGTMGFVAAPESVYAFLSALEQVLPRMGYTVKAGAALPAAQAVFAAGE
jgi:aspartate aminotransferase-like enzyme